MYTARINAAMKSVAHIDRREAKHYMAAGVMPPEELVWLMDAKVARAKWFRGPRDFWDLGNVRDLEATARGALEGVRPYSVPEVAA